MFKELIVVHESIIQNGLDTALYDKHKSLQEVWEELCTREEVYWRQNSWEIWLREGDRNTKKIHASTQIKKETKSIHSI